MASLNRVFLIGNLTRDPEVRYTPKGTQVVELGLAVNRVTKDENGEKKEEVTFVDVTLWARQAEVAGQYLRKGSPVMIEGRLQLDTWDDKQTGQKRSRLRVVAENLQLLGSINRQDSDTPPRPFRPAGSTAPASEAPPRIRESIDRMRQAASGAAPSDVPAASSTRSVGGPESAEPLDISF
jgi:single stranded DNA-binding protein